MQVVVEGRVPEEPTQDAECLHCESVLRYAMRDVRRVAKNTPMAWITCPICQAPVTVPSTFGNKRVKGE